MKGQVEIDEILEGIAQIRLLSRVITEMEMDEDSLATASTMMHQVCERVDAAGVGLEAIVTGLQYVDKKKEAPASAETPIALAEIG